MKAAYADYATDTLEHSEEVLNFEDWCHRRRLESPHFRFWDLILAMEVTILTLIRSFREANFGFEALSELLPYFFANNNVNYARWFTIHLRDMMSIDQQHPEVAKGFHKGNFVVHKSERAFSGLAIEDPTALRRWMVAGPGVSRLLAR